MLTGEIESATFLVSKVLIKTHTKYMAFLESSQQGWIHIPETTSLVNLSPD
jgi:hypothetical protein